MSFLVRRWLWRAGRKLYMMARRDEPNDMATNGELRLQRLVVRKVRPGSQLVVFDVGARIGEWSRALVEASRERERELSLHVFEPVPDSRSQLQEALRTQIESGSALVNDCAVSDQSTVLPLYVPHFTGGTSTLHADSTVAYEQVIEVQTTTLDEYCRRHAIDQIDLVKVDTEGNDLRVIRGAADLLAYGRIGVIQFEYNYRWIHSRTYLKDVFDLVRNLPYRVAKVCGPALEIYMDWDPELERFFETNYALVHERLIAPLGAERFRIGFGKALERHEKSNPEGTRAEVVRASM
jgi:FkbM family methyltransferase